MKKILYLFDDINYQSGAQKVTFFRTPRTFASVITKDQDSKSESTITASACFINL